VTGTKLQFAGDAASVTVHASSEKIATEQVKLEERQRAFGVIPNFYVVYDHEGAPLTAKLKFKLALRASTDPVIFVAIAFIAGADQAVGHPNFEQGMKGYGQRMGALYANGSRTSWLARPSCNPFCIRTYATSTREQVRNDPS
jgi:hypothetical protein